MYEHENVSYCESGHMTSHSSRWASFYDKAVSSHVEAVEWVVVEVKRFYSHLLPGSWFQSPGFLSPIISNLASSHQYPSEITSSRLELACWGCYMVYLCRCVYLMLAYSCTEDCFTQVIYWHSAARLMRSHTDWQSVAWLIRIHADWQSTAFLMRTQTPNGALELTCESWL